LQDKNLLFTYLSHHDLGSVPAAILGYLLGFVGEQDHDRGGDVNDYLTIFDNIQYHY